MKKLLIATVLLGLFSTLVIADTYVKGYFKKDGTYVQPHYRSSPNRYRYDNYSSEGNSNPYTGEKGYQRNEFSDPPVYNTPSTQYQQNWDNSDTRESSGSTWDRGYSR